MIRENKYREYQLVPYIGVDIGGVPTPSISTDGKLEIYGATPIVPVGSGALTTQIGSGTLVPVGSGRLTPTASGVTSPVPEVR